MNRRDFLKTTGKTALIISGASGIQGLLNGCVSQIKPFKEEVPVIFPKLKGQKIQPPDAGCFLGIYSFVDSPRDWFTLKIGVEPKISTPMVRTFEVYDKFPKTLAERISESETIPFFYLDLTKYIEPHGFKNLIENKEFAERIKKYADDIVEFGKPIFISTMRELNGNWFPWGHNPKIAIKVWKHMWNIFEQRGANEYTTWVWEIYCPNGAPSSIIGNPNSYYPGDQFVDWIGLSGYSRDKINRTGSMSFNELFYETYKTMRRYHDNKPVMIAECGKTRSKNQSKWYGKAITSLKNMPGLKGFIPWNNINHELPSDCTFTEETYQLFKEVVKDPYFITAKPFVPKPWWK